MSSNVVKRLSYPLLFKTNETAQFFENRKSFYREIIEIIENLYNLDPEHVHVLLFVLAIILMVLLNISGIPDELQRQSPIPDSFPSIEEIIATVLSGGSLKELFANYLEADKKLNCTTVSTTDKTRTKRRKK